MREEFVPIADAITLVTNGQHAEASQIVNDLLSARVLDSLQAHKETIAQSLFAPSADSLSEEVEELDEKNWIAGAVKNKGGLHRALHVPQGEKIPVGKIEAASHKPGKIGKEARLAQTLSHLHEEELTQEEYESVEEFKKRGGTVKQIPAHKSYSAPKAQTIKKAKQYFVKKG